MRTVLMPSMIPLLLALCWAPPSPAADKASDTTPHDSFYRVSLSFSNADQGNIEVYLGGYAALQWQSSGDVIGKIFGELKNTVGILETALGLYTGAVIDRLFGGRGQGAPAEAATSG